MKKEVRLKMMARVLEAIGDVREYEVKENEFETSEEVFYQLAQALQWGPYGARVDMYNVLPSPEKLKKRLEWKREQENEGKEWIDEVGGADRSFQTTLTDMLSVRSGERIPNVGRIAKGVIDSLELLDEHKDLRNMYEDYVAQYENKELAMEKLKERIEDIHGMGEKKTLVFLRQYDIRADAGMPIKQLPLPWYERHVKRVMKRTGFVKNEEAEKAIRKAGKEYFTVPLIGDFGLWYIGRRYCKKNNPDCENCPLSTFKGEPLCFKNI